MSSRLSFLSLLSALLISCGGGNSTPASNSQSTVTTPCGGVNSSLDLTSFSATYCATFTAQWTDANFVNVPAGAHFTSLVGSAVNSASTLWNTGSQATAGLELVAELGQTPTFISEIDTEVAANRALRAFTAAGTRATGSSSFELTVNRTYPLFTFASMLAPSPDWFIGLSEHSILNNNGEWPADTGDVSLRVYDAGTETGSVFSLNGIPTNPQQNISRLTENVGGIVSFVDGTVNGNFIATIRFRRIR